MKLLFVTDMQNDFIDGSLGTKEAQAIVGNVVEKVKNFDGMVVFSRDTHFDNYMDTQEGKKLPVVHCVKDTDGWQICNALQPYVGKYVFDKVTFGSSGFGPFLQAWNLDTPIESVEFVGLCTDICVISNVVIAKAFLPEAEIIVDASCCAGVTPETHKNALEAMKVFQVTVIND